MQSMLNIIEIRFVDIHGKLKAMNVPVTIHDLQTANSDPVFTEGASIDGNLLHLKIPIYI